MTSQTGPVGDPEDPTPAVAPQPAAGTDLSEGALDDVTGGAFPVSVNDGITDSIT